MTEKCEMDMVVFSKTQKKESGNLWEIFQISLYASTDVIKIKMQINMHC